MAYRIEVKPECSPDCENCEYMKLNDNRSGSHCYMFSDKPGLKCGQFREAWNTSKHGTGPLTGNY